MFHLTRILQAEQCSAILDFGGNVGVHYLRYRKYLDLKDITWIVCDVPEITKRGEIICANFPNIKFVNVMADVKDTKFDIFLAVASMNYLRHPDSVLEDLVSNHASIKHILIDQLPLHECCEFVTLQNGGAVVYPLHVLNRNKYIESILKLGYSLFDSWTDSVDSCLIPFHPDKSVHSYSGMYFRKEC